MVSLAVVVTAEGMDALLLPRQCLPHFLIVDVSSKTTQHMSTERL